MSEYTQGNAKKKKKLRGDKPYRKQEKKFSPIP